MGAIVHRGTTYDSIVLIQKYVLKGDFYGDRIYRKVK